MSNICRPQSVSAAASSRAAPGPPLALGRFRDTETLLRQQRACLTQLQDAWLAGRYALLLSQTTQHLGEWGQAAQDAHHAVEAATACHDAETIGQAPHVLAMERYWAGSPSGYRI